MDQGPEVNIKERDGASCHDSATSSLNKTSRQHSHDNKTPDDHLPPPHLAAFPSNTSPNSSEQQLSRNDSISSTTNEDDAKSQHIEAEYARYTDAPPPYSEKQYEGKSEDEQTRMRRVDYAKELKRMMGKQLVKELKTEVSESAKSQ